MAKKGHYIRCFGHIIYPKKPFLRLDSAILQSFNLELQNNFHDHLYKKLTASNLHNHCSPMAKKKSLVTC